MIVVLQRISAARLMLLSELNPELKLNSKAQLGDARVYLLAVSSL